MENQNSVCFIARINEIKSIEGADNIELGVIGGWNCIIKKGEYKVDDLVVVATTDAVIPQKLSDAINVTNYLRKGQRVRTVKLRGVYSECLIIPIGFIPDKYRYEGADCMELMSIFKYEPPAVQIQLSSGRKIRYHQNPNFSIYYKFPNYKNVKGMFNEEDTVEVSRKLHGTNARFGIVRKKRLTLLDRLKVLFGNKWAMFEYSYGSHNVEKGSDSQGFYSTDVWKTIAEKYNIRQNLWNYVKFYETVETIGTGIVIYGEIYGPGIQKNFDYGLKEPKYAGFDTTVNGSYVPCDNSSLIHAILNLDYVPILTIEKWSEELPARYLFDKIQGTKVPHEGVVIKSIDGDRHKVAKVINPDYTIYSEKNEVGDSH